MPISHYLINWKCVKVKFQCLSQTNEIWVKALIHSLVTMCKLQLEINCPYSKSWTCSSSSRPPFRKFPWVQIIWTLTTKQKLCQAICIPALFMIRKNSLQKSISLCSNHRLHKSKSQTINSKTWSQTLKTTMEPKWDQTLRRKMEVHQMLFRLMECQNPQIRSVSQKLQLLILCPKTVVTSKEHVLRIKSRWRIRALIMISSFCWSLWEKNQRKTKPSIRSSHHSRLSTSRTNFSRNLAGLERICAGCQSILEGSQLLRSTSGIGTVTRGFTKVFHSPEMKKFKWDMPMRWQ